MSTSNKKIQKHFGTKWNIIVSGVILTGYCYFIRILQLDYEQNYYGRDEVHTKTYVTLNAWIPIFLLSIFGEMLLFHFRKQEVYRANDSLSSLSLGSYNTVVTNLISKIFHVNVYNFIWMNYGKMINANYLPSFLQNATASWWFMFFGVEFCYYWVHRTGHTWSLGWATHSIHHSSEEYNLTTALRQSAFHQLISWIYYLPLAFFFDPYAFFLQNEFSLLYQYWIHTEAVGKLGPLEYFLNTPSQHRVHHGTNNYCIDVNYGGTLCIFDRMFGTFIEEKDDEIINYGITTPLNTFSPVGANTIPLQQLFDKFKNQKGIKDKILTFWYGPGWDPTSPPIEKQSNKKKPFIKYNPPLEFGFKWYIIFMGFFFIIIVQAYLDLFRSSNFGVDKGKYFYSLFGIFAAMFVLFVLNLSFDKDRRTPFLHLVSNLIMGTTFILGSFIYSEFLDATIKNVFYSIVAVYVICAIVYARAYSKSILTKQKSK